MVGLQTTERAHLGVIGAASRLANASSRTLLGILGGSAGMVAGTALGTFSPVLLALTPIFSMIGVVVGILMARGTRQIVTERPYAEQVDKARLIRLEIAAARADGIPKEHEADLWNLHRQCLRSNSS